DEGHAGILAGPRKAEALDREDALDPLLFLEEIIFHLLEGFHCACLGRAHGGLDLGNEHALVLIRHEAGGQAEIEDAHGDAEEGKDDHEAPGAGEDITHPAAVFLAAAFEIAVEPAEETALADAMTLLDGLEHGGAKGG